MGTPGHCFLATNVNVYCIQGRGIGVGIRALSQKIPRTKLELEVAYRSSQNPPQN